MNGDLETLKQIRADMEALAAKWGLEFVYHQHVNGVVEMKVAVAVSPVAPEGSAAAPGPQEVGVEPQ